MHSPDTAADRMDDVSATNAEQNCVTRKGTGSPRMNIRNTSNAPIVLRPEDIDLQPQSFT